MRGRHAKIMAEVCVADGRRQARIEAGQPPSSPELSSEEEMEEKEDGDLMVMTEITMEEADEEQAPALVEKLPVTGFSLLQAENTTTWC